MAAQRTKVLVSGGACLATNVHIDHPGGLQAHTTVGCMGAGKALNLARLGMDVTLHTALGDDQPGARIRALLQREPLRLIVDTDPAGTNTHVNLMDGAGGRTGVPLIAPSPVPAVEPERLAPVLDSADIVVLNPNGVCRPLLPLLPGLRADIWCDLGDYRTDDDFFAGFAAAARYVTMSGLHIDDPLPVLEAMVADGKEVAVITYGSRGSIAAAADGRIIRTPAQTGWEQVDTNGAGDTFLAGLLYAHTAGHRWRMPSSSPRWPLP